MNKIIIAGLLFVFKINVVLAHTDTFAYVTNAATPSSISLCAVDSSTGQFETCDALYLEDLSSPLDIAFAAFEGVTYAYMANSNYPAFITRCQVGYKGALHACMPSDVPSYAGITFYETEKLYAYLTHDSSVKKCMISPQGELAHQLCFDSGAGPIFTNGAVYIHFQTFNQVNYAYIANGDYHVGATIIQCAVNDQGDFVNCIDTGMVFNGAADIDFAQIKGHTYAYITQSGGGLVKCKVDLHTGLFNDCAPTGGEFHTPLGMSIKKINDSLFAYIVDGGFRAPYINQVMQCLIDSSGDLDCADSGVGSVFANPFGIALLLM